MKNYIDGQIDIIGTPDEEVLGGKIVMAEKNIFVDYELAIMIHMDNKNIIYPKMLALDGFYIDFIGKASHASSAPWEGKNALNAVQLFFHSIDMMRQHVKHDIRIHGYIKEGGKAPNIIPDFASAEIYTRGLNREYLNDISEWIKECAIAAAMATRTNVEIKKLCPSLKDLSYNNTGSKILEKIYLDMNLELHEYDDGDFFGSSDIGHVDYQCPTFQPTISINQPYALHTVEFAQIMKSKETHNAILKGGEIIAKFIITILDNKELLTKIKHDHTCSRKV